MRHRGAERLGLAAGHTLFLLSDRGDSRAAVVGLRVAAGHAVRRAVPRVRQCLRPAPAGRPAVGVALGLWGSHGGLWARALGSFTLFLQPLVRLGALGVFKLELKLVRSCSHSFLNGWCVREVSKLERVYVFICTQ